MKGPDGSIPPDSGTRVGVGSAKGEKCQHLSVTAWQMANYHFFSASLSSTRTKLRSCRLCCLHHFPPPLHLWYANGKMERFCAAEKDLWAYSLGQQFQLLCRGSACCTRSLVPRNIPPPCSSFKKKKKKSGINHLAVSVPRNLLEQIVTWYTPIGYSLDQQATSRIGVSSANPCPTSVQFESWEMMVSSLPQSSSRLSGAEVVQKYFSVYTDALHSWEQK